MMKHRAISATDSVEAPAPLQYRIPSTNGQRFDQISETANLRHTRSDGIPSEETSYASDERGGEVCIPREAKASVSTQSYPAPALAMTFILVGKRSINSLFHGFI